MFVIESVMPDGQKLYYTGMPSTPHSDDIRRARFFLTVGTATYQCERLNTFGQRFDFEPTYGGKSAIREVEVNVSFVGD